jgi:hypothetical protein
MINEGWAVLSEVAFLVWILTVIGFILQAFPSLGIFKSRTSIYWGLGIIVSYGAWITGMLKA